MRLVLHRLDSYFGSKLAFYVDPTEDDIVHSAPSRPDLKWLVVATHRPAELPKRNSKDEDIVWQLAAMKLGQPLFFVFPTPVPWAKVPLITARAEHTLKRISQISHWKTLILAASHGAPEQWPMPVYFHCDPQLLPVANDLKLPQDRSLSPLYILSRTLMEPNGGDDFYIDHRVVPLGDGRQGYVDQNNVAECLGKLESSAQLCLEGLRLLMEGSAIEVHGSKALRISFTASKTIWKTILGVHEDCKE